MNPIALLVAAVVGYLLGQSSKESDKFWKKKPPVEKPEKPPVEKPKKKPGTKKKTAKKKGKKNEKDTEKE